MNTLREQSASNRLYRGEVTNAREAIETYIQALREEREVQRRLSADFAALGQADEDAALVDDLGRFMEEAGKCLQVYDSKVRAAERELAEAWLDSISETHRLIADAILSGDFSGLAV